MDLAPGHDVLALQTVTLPVISAPHKSKAITPSPYLHEPPTTMGHTPTVTASQTTSIPSDPHRVNVSRTQGGGKVQSIWDYKLLDSREFLCVASALMSHESGVQKSGASELIRSLPLLSIFEVNVKHLPARACARCASHHTL